MKITVKKLADLRKPAHNIRRHSDKQITEYVRSIEMFGQIKPLVVDEHGEIIAGNGLFEALTRMGRETCDCYVVTGLTDVQKKKLMMADNKVYELGFTDTDAIEQLVKELDGDTDVPGWDADLLKMLDSTIEEADEIVNDYGSFPDTEVANMNRRPVEEHIPYASNVQAMAVYNLAQQLDLVAPGYYRSKYIDAAKTAQYIEIGQISAGDAEHVTTLCKKAAIEYKTAA